jgi:DNA-binding transcriptional LysR family regulator
MAMSAPSSVVLRNRLVSHARIRHLQVLMRVAEFGTVTRAAQAIGVTQPAVTHALADLEEMLGTPLFFRHARGMNLTPAGQALLPVARRILAAIDDGAEQIAAVARNGSGVVRVAAITAAIAGFLVRSVPAFRKKHPGIVVQLQEADPFRQADLVSRSDIDVSFCRAPSVTPAGWRFVPLIEDRFAVVAGSGHPLLSKSRVGMAALRQATWLIAPASTAAREAFDRLFGSDDAMPASSQVITSVPAMFWAMLCQEELLAILPASFARQLVDAGEIFEVKLEEEIPFEPIGMLHPEVDMGEGAQTFCQFLEGFALREKTSVPPGNTRHRRRP